MGLLTAERSSLKALAMRLFVRFASVLMVGMVAAAPTSAQMAGCISPFSPGFWGFGNYCSPGYGGMYGAYAPVWPSYAPPMNYGVGYGGFDNCGCSSCCDPCGGSCGTGCSSGCATGSCGAVGTGTLKPAEDDNFRSKAPAGTEPTGTEPADNRNREFGNDAGDNSRRPAEDRYERDNAPIDGFDTPIDRRPVGGLNEDPGWESSGSRTPGVEGTGSGVGASPANANEDGLFPEDNFGPIRNSNKPPMSDPLESNGAGAPADGNTPVNPSEPNDSGAGTNTDDFLSPVDPSASLPKIRQERFVSRLRDVVPAQRLARRSLPGARDQSTIAGHQPSQGKIRWISLPSVDGRARL